MVTWAFLTSGKNSNQSTPKLGSGIIITNTEVDSEHGYLCKYKIQETNNSSDNQNIKIDISLGGKNWFGLDYRDNNDEYKWEDKPLYTGSPRIDYLDGVPCPEYMDKNGVTKIMYSISDAGSGKFLIGNTIKPSTNFVPESIPTPSYSLQRQCGQDAREFMKQYNDTQILMESSYSTKLQACTALTEDISDNEKSVYNVTTSYILAGYLPITQTTPIPTPTLAPTNSPNFLSSLMSQSMFSGSSIIDNSGYFIDNAKNSAFEYVSYDEFNRYLQWLGLSTNQ